MRKELKPTHDAVSCAVCGRTILKGERTEAYPRSGGAAQARLRALHGAGR